MRIFALVITVYDVCPRYGAFRTNSNARNTCRIVAVLLVAFELYNSKEVEYAVLRRLECNRNVLHLTCSQLRNIRRFANKRFGSFIIAVYLDAIFALRLRTYVANLNCALVIVAYNSFLYAIEREGFQVVFCDIVYVNTIETEAIVLVVRSNRHTEVICAIFRSSKHILEFLASIHIRIREVFFFTENRSICEVFTICSHCKFQVEWRSSLMCIEVCSNAICLTLFELERGRSKEAFRLLVVAIANHTLRILIISTTIVEEDRVVVGAVPTICVVLRIEL